MADLLGYPTHASYITEVKRTYMSMSFVLYSKNMKDLMILLKEHEYYSLQHQSLSIVHSKSTVFLKI